MFLKVHVYLKIRKLHYLISIVHKYLAWLYHNVLRIKVCDKVRRIKAFYWKKAQALLCSKYEFLSDFFETYKVFILAQKCHEGVNLWQLVNTWNLKSKFKFHVFPSHQDRKTNSSIRFWEKLRLNNFVSRSTDLQTSFNLHNLWFSCKQ